MARFLLCVFVLFLNFFHFCFGNNNASLYKCREGFSYFPATGFCYGSLNQSTTSVTWEYAENGCQSLGGHIVTLDSVVELRHVLSIFHYSFRNTWLGLYLDNAHLKWYVNDRLVGADYPGLIRWCPTHPWIHIGGPRCMGLGYDGFVCLFSQNCNSDANMQMVCKAKPELIEPKQSPIIVSMGSCKDGWQFFPLTGFCYGAIAESPRSITWQNAENHCVANGGHLVTLETFEEFRLVLSYFHVAWRNTWIGTTIATVGGHSTSVDGSSVALLLHFMRWCHTHPWLHLGGGRRCLGLGYERDVCLFDQNCVTDDNMQMLCKARPENPKPPVYEDPEVPEIPYTVQHPKPPTVAVNTASDIPVTVRPTRKQSCSV